jgi:hypothetical protein
VKDVNQRFKVRFVMDNVDEQIDTVSRAALALTVSCARCHDHKFDPIPTADYYALAGVFRSTDLLAGVRNKMGGGGLDYYDTNMLIKLGDESQPTKGDAAKLARATEAYEAAKKEFEAIRGTPRGLAKAADGFPTQRPYRLKMLKFQNELLALTDPARSPGGVALGVRDAETVGDTEIRIRGEAERLGKRVPRGFLGVVSFPGQPRVDPKHSGRLELASWIADARNPLTSRVFVNRVWMHLFGQGLVRSVDNFGVTGDVPSHAALLDDLAGRFVADGWSVKRLVRRLVLTRTYQLGSDATAANLTADPSNRLLWRHAPRRLDAEEIRDAELAAAGSLDRSPLKGSPAAALRVVELPNNGPLARRLGDEARASRRRSVYLPLLRGLTPTSLEVFDFAEQGMTTGRRETTTVAPQALYFLNDPFVRRRALELATRVLERSGLDESARVDMAYRLALGRSPTSLEADRARRYLADYEPAARVVLASSSSARPERPARPAPAVALAAADATNAAGAAKAAVPINPDEIVPADAPVVEEDVTPPDARTAAWASFCQALFGSAEFRYVR